MRNIWLPVVLLRLDLAENDFGYYLDGCLLVNDGYVSLEIER